MKRRDILDALPAGYGLIQVKSSHLGIVREDGSRLRSETGLPICIALTPSDWRSARNELSRVKRAIAATAAGR